MSLEDTYQELIDHIQRWDRRFRWINALFWFPRGILIPLYAAAIVAALARLRPVLTNREVAHLVLGSLAVGFLIILFSLLFHRRDILQKARLADRRFGLSERISTAIEIRNGDLVTTEALAELQLTDAVHKANQVDVKGSLPLRLNLRDVIFILVPTILLLLAVVMPNPQVSVVQEQRAINQAIDKQVEVLKGLEEEVQENTSLQVEKRETLLEPIQSALQGMQGSAMSQERAVAVLSEAEAKLRELAEVNSTDTLEQVLEEAGQALSDDPFGSSLGQAFQSGNFSTAGALVNELADRLLEMSEGELGALADSLTETAAALQDVAPELATALSNAAENLQQGRLEEAAQELRQGAGTLHGIAQEQAAANLATDAAEQLDQGQQQVAQAGQTEPGTMESGRGEGQIGQGQDQLGGGLGSNGGQESNLDQNSSGDLGGDAGGSGSGGGHVDNVYVPEFIDLSDGAGVDIELPAECVTNPQSCGGLITESDSEMGNEESLVPYTQVFGDYRQAAYQALEDPYIPLGLRDFVRDYFSSLEP